MEPHMFPLQESVSKSASVRRTALDVSMANLNRAEDRAALYSDQISTAIAQRAQAETATRTNEYYAALDEELAFLGSAADASAKATLLIEHSDWIGEWDDGRAECFVRSLARGGFVETGL